MVKRIVVPLEQDEFLSLLEMAVADLRSPADEMRHILRLEMKRRNMEVNIQSEKIDAKTSENVMEVTS